MADNKEPLENKEGQSPPANSGNDDWKAKYEELQKEHNTVVQQRNMYRNKSEEFEGKLQEAEKKRSDLQADFDNLRTEKEKSEKSIAIDKKRDEILGKYSDKTKELAKDLGIDLSDPEDADAIKAFTNRLDKLEGTAGSKDSGGEGDNKPPAPKITSDNKRPEGNTKPKSEEEMLAEEEAKLADVKF